MNGDLTPVLDRARRIWGDARMEERDIAVAMGVVYGDICRAIRDGAVYDLDRAFELQKELGNMILSTVRWADDLGFDLDRCLTSAETCQRDYVAAHWFRRPEPSAL